MNTRKQSDATIAKRIKQLTDAGYVLAGDAYTKDTTTVTTEQVEFCSHKEWDELLTTNGISGEEEPEVDETEEPTEVNMLEREVTNEELDAMTENETVVANARKIVAIADGKNAEKNKPAPAEPKEADELAAAMHQRNIKKYGKDYVTAKRGTNQMFFTRAAWNGMGNNKQGWAEVTKEMPEAKAIAAGKIK